MRPIRRASSRAGFAAPSTAGTHASRRGASCCCALDEHACASGSRPIAEQRREQRRDERAERGARHVAVGARDVQAAAAARSSASAPPPADRHDVRAGVRARRAAIDSVSSVSPEYDDREHERARADELRACGTASAPSTGTGSAAFATAREHVARDPEPPMPSTTMLSTSSAAGSADERRARAAASCAAASCSGSAATASRKPRESRRVAHAARPQAVEGRADAVGRGLGDAGARARRRHRLGLVDQHDRDVVAHRVAALQPRVVERLSSAK